MHLTAIGINHETAPLAVREHFAVDAQQLTTALRALMELDAIQEAVIVSTCNRTEVYASLDCESDNPIPAWLQRWGGKAMASTPIDGFVYGYDHAEAVRHLFRVACGLNSMVLGEPQILGQLKSAYTAAYNANTLGKTLGRLFQTAFAVAKQVRTDTAIGNSPVSVAFAAVRMAKQIFAQLEQSTALLIGAGDTIELVARHLTEQRIKRLIIANRTVERAHALASQFNGYAISLSELSGHLAEADVVVSSTASPLPILGKGAVERALKQRKRKPMFMVDIAVPRDIEPEVAQLEDVFLYDVDDLHHIIQDNLQSRREAAKQAEEIIDVQVEHFEAWLRSQDAVPIIRALRSHAEAHSEHVLQRALKQLEMGTPADQVVTELTRNLTNKFLHEPSRQLRQSGFDEDTSLLEASRRLFNLKDTP